eukprot:9492528-Pyramimonas_sp.AAC.1
MVATPAGDVATEVTQPARSVVKVSARWRLEGEAEPGLQGLGVSVFAVYTIFGSGDIKVNNRSPAPRKERPLKHTPFVITNY